MTGGPFISEIHYDNVGADVGEFIEVCVPAGADPADFSVVLYNGNGGGTYATLNLASVPAANICVVGTKTFYVLEYSGIQNGSPGGDGMALVNNTAGTVCEFLSYEGTITATNGPANGLTSTNIGVSESGLTPIGHSLQLNPAGTPWESAAANTACAPNCFLEGTSILTDTGYRKIELLKIGDHVKDANGKLHDIKWIGIQTIDPQSMQDPSVQPIRISKSAIGKNIPSRDLFLSPNHALFVNGFLINAEALVNNLNIAKLDIQHSFTYFHIELESHELLVAENTFAESYLSYNEKRDKFDNADECFEAKVMYFPLEFPRISSIFKVPEKVKQEILSRAKINKLSRIA